MEIVLGPRPSTPVEHKELFNYRTKSATKVLQRRPSALVYGRIRKPPVGVCRFELKATINLH
jgi:hypothetical protein